MEIVVAIGGSILLKEYDCKKFQQYSAILKDLAKEHDFIQVTEWANEEGFDVTINDNIYSFTESQIDAMFHLKNHLCYHDKD